MTWVVVISSSKYFGRVGLLREKRPDGRVNIQFGTDGPFKVFSRSSIMAIAPLVQQIENRTGGAEFDPWDDD